jgi:hypothetical protein
MAPKWITSLAIAAIVVIGAAGCKKDSDDPLPVPQILRPTWTAPANPVPGAVNSGSPAVAAGSTGIIHLAWTERLGGSEMDIFYANSTNWNATTNISSTTEPSGDAAIAVDSTGLVHVAWEQRVPGPEYQVWYANSGSWAATEEASVGTSGGFEPVIAADEFGTVHAAWRMYGDVYCANSGSWNTTWLVSDPTNTSYSHSLAIGPGNYVHMAWEEEISGICCICYANSGNWTSTRRIMAKTWSETEDSTNPVIAFGADATAHVLWEEGMNSPHYNCELCYSHTPAWPRAKVISKTPNDSYNPVLCVDANGVLHAVWQETELLNPEIYYANSTGWGLTRTNVSDSPGFSVYPAVAAAPDGTIHIAWQESVGGGVYEIRYINSSGP